MNRRISDMEETIDYIDKNENFYLNDIEEHTDFIQVIILLFS